MTFTERAADWVFDERGDRAAVSVLLWKACYALNPELADKVMESGACDISPDCIGTVDVYSSVASFVPRHWTVIDLGCAYAFQSYYFRDHALYVGVDLPWPADDWFRPLRFQCDNTVHVEADAADYVDAWAGKDTSHVFAVSAWVPNWGRGGWMRKLTSVFENALIIYPAGSRARVKATADESAAINASFPRYTNEARNSSLTASPAATEVPRP